MERSHMHATCQRRLYLRVYVDNFEPLKRGVLFRLLPLTFLGFLEGPLLVQMDIRQEWEGVLSSRVQGDSQKPAIGARVDDDVKIALGNNFLQIE